MESGDPNLGDNVLALEGYGACVLSEKLWAEVRTHISELQLTGLVC